MPPHLHREKGHLLQVIYVEYVGLLKVVPAIWASLVPQTPPPPSEKSLLCIEIFLGCVDSAHLKNCMCVISHHYQVPRLQESFSSSNTVEFRIPCKIQTRVSISDETRIFENNQEISQ